MIEAVTQVTGARAEWSAKDARELYAALYLMCRLVDVPSPESRRNHLELMPLFILYDQLDAAGFSS